MTSLRKFLVFVAVLALSAFAAPSSAAPAKIFGLTMDTVPSGNLVAGAVNTISATYTNLTPNGNSTINWVHLSVPKALYGANPSAPPNTPAISLPEGGTLYSVNTSTDPVEIVVNNIPGIGSGGAHWHFEIKVFVPSNPGCFDYTFTATAFTGNSGTQGQPFAYQSVYPATGTPTFTSKPDLFVTNGCVVKFQYEPANAQASQIITSVPSNPLGTPPVTVAVTDGTNPVTSFNGNISLAIKTGPAATLTGYSATASNGVATFPNLSINTAGNYVLTATASPYGSADSTPFTIFANGNIGCTGGYTTSTNNYNSSLGTGNYDYDPDQSNAPAPGTAGNWGLRRGTNYNGADCVLVDYTFTPPASTNGYVASMIYDRTVTDTNGKVQGASWKYLVPWQAITADSSNPTKGWTTWRPWVSWGIDTPTPQTADFVPALFCRGNPGDISTLTAAQLLALLPTLPNDCGAGPNGSDGPFCKANQAHPTVYYLNDSTHPAKMCVSQQGFNSGTDGSGNPVLYPWSEIVDEADGYVGGWQ